MILEMMFDWLWHRFIEVVIFVIAVVLVSAAFWFFLEAIEPYQAAQQALYSR